MRRWCRLPGLIRRRSWIRCAYRLRLGIAVVQKYTASLSVEMPGIRLPIRSQTIDGDVLLNR